MEKLEKLMDYCDELQAKFKEDEMEWEAFRDMYQSEWRINQIEKLIEDISKIIKAHRAIEDYYYDHPEECEGTGSLSDDIRIWAERRKDYIEKRETELYPDEKEKEKEITDEETERWFREIGDHEHEY